MKIDNDKLLTRTKFSQLVERSVHTNRMSYMDAIIYVCEKVEVDPEDVRKYVSRTIVDKLEAEAMRLNFLPQSNTLPLEEL